MQQRKGSATSSRVPPGGLRKLYHIAHNLAFLIGDFLARMARRVGGIIAEVVKGLIEGLEAYQNTSGTRTAQVSV